MLVGSERDEEGNRAEGTVCVYIVEVSEVAADVRAAALEVEAALPFPIVANAELVGTSDGDVGGALFRVVICLSSRRAASRGNLRVVEGLVTLRAELSAALVEDWLSISELSWGEDDGYEALAPQSNLAFAVPLCDASSPAASLYVGLGKLGMTSIARTA